MNLFQAAVERSPDGIDLIVGDRRIRVDEREVAHHPGLNGREGGSVVAGIRAERLGKHDAPAERRLRGSVLLCEALGSDSLAYVAVEGAAALSDAQSGLANDVEDAAEVEELTRETQATVVARLDPRVQIDVDAMIELDIAPGSLYFFDPETGEALG